MLKCPRCNAALTMTENQGYCPQCGGMWFDGEYLNKIIESELKAAANREPENKQVLYWQDIREFFQERFPR
jgi:Zn-finger nucleic acid-binding protein